MLYLYGLLTGAALVAAAWWAWWNFRRYAVILRDLEELRARLQEVGRVAEDASAGVDYLTEDLADLTRRAVALDPQYAYGEGDEEAPD